MSDNTNGHKKKNLVVIQLSGGNDYLNTLVPYQDGLYYDFRPNMGLKGDDVMPLDDKLAFNSHMGTFKNLFEQDKMAVLMGIGYPEPNRSHFRSMDIWHTAEPFTSSSEGWLGKANSLIDPEGKNPITAVNFGRGLPRALAFQGVSVASVGALESYGLYTGLAGARNGDAMLDTISRIYQPMADGGFPSRRILETGRGALDGADLLREAPTKYSSDVEYPEDRFEFIARSETELLDEEIAIRSILRFSAPVGAHSVAYKFASDSGFRVPGRGPTLRHTYSFTEMTPPADSERAIFLLLPLGGDLSVEMVATFREDLLNLGPIGKGRVFVHQTRVIDSRRLVGGTPGEAAGEGRPALD